MRILTRQQLEKWDLRWPAGEPGRRFVEFPTKGLAEFTEGTMISAFRDEYVWNSRNEFEQQWALERP